MKYFPVKIKYFREYRNWQLDKLIEISNRILDEIIPNRNKLLFFSEKLGTYDHHAWMVAMTIKIHAMRGYPWSKEDCAKKIAEYINDEMR